MPDQPKTPQVNFRLEEDTRRKAMAIAKLRKERDAIGFGFSVELRRAANRYVKKWEHMLPEGWDKEA